MSTSSMSTEKVNIQKAIGITILIGCFGILLYSLQATLWKQFLSIFGIALMIAGASLFSGGLLGFLFGIPRSLQQQGRPEESSQSTLEESESKNEKIRVAYGANTNLEQISDWLTKILVGVGLTQITSLPAALESYAEYTSISLGNFPGSKTFSIVLLIYFLICGFLIGYLWTRLSLAPALRQADIDALGGKLDEVKSQLSELEKQVEIDAKALNFIQGYLNPGQGTPPIANNEKEIQEKIEAVILPSSRSVKAQIFYQAQKMRSENWRKPETKPAMERTIPIFRALIASDKDNVFHTNHGQLGFALKDKANPTPADWKEAETELTKAVEIRGPWLEKGWLFYELNRAICRIKLDDNYLKGKRSDKNNKQSILDDINDARQANDLIDIIKQDPLINDWMKKNQVDI